MIEYISRKTQNYRKDIIKYFPREILKWQLESAEVNHCLSFEQVSDELIEKLEIKKGDFDSVKSCRYLVPDFLSIGRVFEQLIISVNQNDIIQTIINVYSSFISDEISNYNSNIFYASPDYLKYSYLEGNLVA